MSEPATIFAVRIEGTTADVVREIAAELGARCRFFANVDRFLSERGDHECGCLVTEIPLPGIDEARLEEKLSAAGCSLPVILLASAATASAAEHSLADGAIAISNDESAGRHELRDALSAKLVAQARAIAATPSTVRWRIDQLTRHERHVLDLMVQGRTSQDMAQYLNVSVRTVELRRRQVLDKMNTDSVVELSQLMRRISEP